MTAAEKQRRRRSNAAPASSGSSGGGGTSGSSGATAGARSPAATQAVGIRLIRKYGNRRLYDTHTSRYVTLGDLLEVFSGAEEVQVVDAVSGDDLTKRVLSQAILFEEGRRGTPIVPTTLLRALLRLRGEVTREVYERKLQKLVAEVSVPSPQGSVGKPGSKGGDALDGASPKELDELRRRLKAIESQMGRRK